MHVAVVGAGPVGLLLAGELRLGGATVTVLERRSTPDPAVRATTLHARTMELLARRGLVGALPPREDRGHVGGIPLDLTGADTPYPGQWKVPQPRLAARLEEWATGLGATVRRGYAVTGLTGTGVTDGTGPVHADWVVGCDGEESAVRRLAGIPFPGTDAGAELLAADVAGLALRDRRFERTATGVATAARRPDGLTRVMVHARGRPVGPSTPDYAAVAAAWHHVTGEDIAGGEPRWLHSFQDASRLAERYRAGSVLLAGDAAHRCLPVGGQALNLGLADAADLGPKLALVATGRAPATLLDTYEAERRAAGRQALDGVRAQTTLLLGGPELDPVRAVLTELLGLPQARSHMAARIGGLTAAPVPALPRPTGSTRPRREASTR